MPSWPDRHLVHFRNIYVHIHSHTCCCERDHHKLGQTKILGCPFLRSNFSTSAWPSRLLRILVVRVKAVEPDLSCALSYAPLCSSSFATSTWPLTPASIKAAVPFLLVEGYPWVPVRNVVPRRSGRRPWVPSNPYPTLPAADATTPGQGRGGA